MASHKINLKLTQNKSFRVIETLALNGELG